MDEEKWFSAEEAKDLGFAHEIFTGEDEAAAQNRAAWNLSAYNNVPNDLINQVSPECERPSREKFDRYLDMINRIG